MPVADLHCDLLFYLQQNKKRSPLNPEARCSFPQLLQGDVKAQIMAVFSETCSGSSKIGWEQVEIFERLHRDYSDILMKLGDHCLPKDGLGTLLAIENASSLFEENDPLKEGFHLIELIEKKVSALLYIGLTWNSENRFGGGAHTSIGLKEDGKQLLEFLSHKRIAVDLSHTSDKLAYDILNTIDQQKFSIPVIASHSNLRTVCNVPRNLPNELAKEIIKREGVIGINLYREFVGPSLLSNLAKQLEHFLQLGAENYLCFGADFFFHGDLINVISKTKKELYFQGYEDARCYPKVLNFWNRYLSLSEQILEKIAYQNFCNYLKEKRFELKV